jgi:flagellar motor component MotA
MKNYPCNPDLIPLIVRPWVGFDRLKDVENYCKAKWEFLKSVREGGLKMVEHNMQDSINIIYDTILAELSMQGINKEIIHKIMEDLLESVHYNVKWKLPEFFDVKKGNNT